MSIELKSIIAQNEAAERTAILPTIQLNPHKPSRLSRLVYSVVNCTKQFGLGVAATGIITPVSTGITYLAQAGGFIPELTQENNIKGLVDNFHKKGLYKFNATKLLNATCYMEEYTNQLNSHFQKEAHLTPTILKAISAANVGVIAPITEELLFRGLVQDVLLTRVPKFVVKKFAPGKESMLDSSSAKAARILLTSAMFSAFHLQNTSIMSKEYVAAQLVATFAMGIGFGLLKESKAGLLGAIGAHMTNNFIAISPQLMSC